MTDTINHVYPAILDDLLGGFDLVGATLVLAFVDTTFAYDATDVNLSDVTGTRIGTHYTLAGTLSASGGVLETDTNDTTCGAVPASTNDLAAVLLCVDGASDSVRKLVACYQRSAAGGVVIDVDTDGGNVVVSFPFGQLIGI